MSNNTTYKSAGVDTELASSLVEDVKPAIADTQNEGSKIGSVGGFGALFALSPYINQLEEPVLVSATDGVGTKLEIANKMDKHSTIGQDLVAMCVNDLIVQGAKPLFFLDYFATGKLEKRVASEVIISIAKACKLANSALIGGETAEMPGLYKQGDYDIAGFSVGVVDKKNILPKLDEIAEGDGIIGIASSGVHSNGYSLVRHIIKQAGVNLHDIIKEIDEKKPLGEVLLNPTKIYVNACLELVEKSLVKALCHITGGGFYENLPRILPSGFNVEVDSESFPRPAIFSWLQKTGNIAEEEMFKTFNCGIGMVIIASQQKSEDILTSLANSGEKAYLIGKITKGKKQVIIR